MENFEKQAQKIKALRKARSLSQGELAYLIGVRQPCIAYYEQHGVRNIAIASKIAKVLNVSLDTFQV